MNEAQRRLRRMMGQKPMVISHARYGNGLALGRPPENTLPAFRRAIAEGADGIETDVQVTADGEFILLHDGDVDRTTNGTGRADQMTLPEIKGLSVFYGRDEFADEKMMTLDELAAILPEDKPLLLEIKSDRFLEAGIVTRFIARLDLLGISERVAVVSFSLDRIQAIRAKEPAIPIGWIVHKPWVRDQVWPKKDVDMLGPTWPLLAVNPTFVWIAHQRGQVVCPLDPQPEKRLAWYRFLGIDAVISNDPLTTLRACGR